MVIDTSFDFRTDAGGRDADAYSATLRKYHKLLWSKALPCGRRFDLTDTVRGVYLHHSSDLGKFFLCSDSIMHTYTRWASLKHITGLFSEEENEAFRTVAYTIGGYTVFPGNKIDSKQTINGARGFNRAISGPFRSDARVHPPPLRWPEKPARRNIGQVPRVFRVVPGLQRVQWTSSFCMTSSRPTQPPCGFSCRSMISRPQRCRGMATNIRRIDASVSSSSKREISGSPNATSFAGEAADPPRPPGTCRSPQLVGLRAIGELPWLAR